MSRSLAVHSLGVMTLMQFLKEHASLAITLVEKDQPVLHAAGDTNCLTGSPFDPNADTKITAIEYWYGVETAVNDTSNFDYTVESKIYSVSFSLHMKKPTFSSLLTSCPRLIGGDSVNIVVLPI